MEVKEEVNRELSASRRTIHNHLSFYNIHFNSHFNFIFNF